MGKKLVPLPVAGSMPVMSYLMPAQLRIDDAYQRSLDTAPSQGLIRRIAENWDWGLCQPLVVSRRDGNHFVIDGQHRLAGALLRNDIAMLPCVVVEYPSPQAEAAAFVEINKARRPLSALDIFRARVASGDEEANAVNETIERAGLQLSTHSNNTAMRPGTIANIGGILRAWKEHGGFATGLALELIAQAYPGEVLRYVGTIFPGVVAIIGEDRHDFSLTTPLRDMIAGKSQEDWRILIAQARADDPDLRFHQASERVFSDHWDEALGAYLDREAA